MKRLSQEEGVHHSSELHAGTSLWFGRSLLGPGPGSGLQSFQPPGRRRALHTSRSSRHQGGRGLHGEEGSRAKSLQTPHHQLPSIPTGRLAPLLAV